MCVCRASSCEQTSFWIKSVFSSVITDLGRPESSFLYTVPLSLNWFKFFYGCVSPVFRLMVFPNFIRRPAFFFIIILNDEFVLLWKHHCEQRMKKKHCKQRGSSLTIYSNVMLSNSSEDTALYFHGKKNLSITMIGNNNVK